MITSAQRLNANRARLFLPLDGMWRQDVGANLVVDGDMEAAGTAAWVPVNSPILTKETLDPYAGSRYMRVAYNGVNYPCATQADLRAATTYHWVYAFRASGAGAIAEVYLNGSVRADTSSTVWQIKDEFYTSAGSGSWQLRLKLGAPGQYAEFDSVDVREQPLTSRNVGTYPGAPSYIRMGDGHTAATVPNQRSSSRGVSLSGTSYVRVPMDYVYNEPFSISILTDSILPAASWLAATYDSATLRGIRFGTTGSGALVAGLFDNGGRSITLTSANNAVPTHKQPRLYTLSYDGGLSAAGLTMRIDDMIVPAVGGGTALASSISSGRDLLLGARWNAATPAEIMAASNVYAASSFDTVLDSYEIRMLRGQMMREMRR